MPYRYRIPNGRSDGCAPIALSQSLIVEIRCFFSSAFGQKGATMAHPVVTASRIATAARDWLSDTACSRVENYFLDGIAVRFIRHNFAWRRFVDGDSQFVRRDWAHTGRKKVTDLGGRHRMSCHCRQC